MPTKIHNCYVDAVCQLKLLLKYNIKYYRKSNVGYFREAKLIQLLSKFDTECKFCTHYSSDVAVKVDVQFQAVVSPRSKLQIADLDVERKI